MFLTVARAGYVQDLEHPLGSVIVPHSVGVPISNKCLMHELVIWFVAGNEHPAALVVDMEDHFFL